MMLFYDTTFPNSKSAFMAFKNLADMSSRNVYEGLDGGGVQMSVVLLVKNLTICQLSVKWL